MPKEPLPRRGRAQVPRHRHRQFRRAHEVHEAARRLQRAEHADRRRQSAASTSPSRAWTTSRRRPSRARSMRSTSCSRRAPAGQSRHLHGRQGRCGGADREGAERSGAAQIPGRQANPSRKNPGVEPWPKPSKPRQPLQPRPSRISSPRCCRRNSSRRPTGRVPRSSAPCRRSPSRRCARPRSSPMTSSAPSRRSSPRSTRSSSDQINLILHNERFQQLESAWRGLHYLVNNTETDEMLKIRVMNISKKDLGKTLKKYKGAAWDQSPLFKKLYEAGVRPAGRRAVRLPGRRLLLRSHPGRCRAARARWRRSPRPRMRRSSPAAGPSLMGMDSWQELANPRDLAKIFGAPDYAAWRSLRESDDAKYIGLAMPRFLARLPYGAKTQPGGGVRIRGGDRCRRPQHVTPGPIPATRWRSTSTARSRCYGWCSSIRGVESGGAVEGLPGPYLPERRRRRGHEVSHRDRHQRPARGGAGELRPDAAHSSQEHRYRGLHRRAVAAEAAGVHRSGCDRERAPRGAPAVPVRQLPLRALPEVHGARQDRLVQGARRHGALSVRLDHGLRARQSRERRRDR